MKSFLKPATHAIVVLSVTSVLGLVSSTLTGCGTSAAPPAPAMQDSMKSDGMMKDGMMKDGDASVGTGMKPDKKM